MFNLAGLYCYCSCHGIPGWVKYDAGDNDYGLLFAAGSAATAQTINFTAKNDADAIFKGVMLAKEKGFF